jgi:hypothetical protein
MTNRYAIPDPLCEHKRKGIVTAGSVAGTHAATNVCDRLECIEDAKAWAYAMTHKEAVFVADQEEPASLFDQEAVANG